MSILDIAIQKSIKERNLKRTKNYTVVGYSAFCKLFEPDDYNGVKRWTMQFYPATMEDWDIIKKSGIRVKKKDPTEEQRVKWGLPAGSYINLRRDCVKKIKGKDVNFDPPAVFTDEGKVDPDEGIAIGNGSKVKVEFEAYDTAMGIGHRLNRIRILDLVVYEPEDEPGEDDGTDGKDNPW